MTVPLKALGQKLSALLRDVWAKWPAVSEERLRQLELKAQTSPQHDRTILALAQAYQKAGRFRDASETYWYLASLYQRDQQPLKALSVLHQLVQMDSTSLPALKAYGDMLEHLSRYKEAAHIYEYAAWVAEQIKQPQQADQLAHQAKVLAARGPILLPSPWQDPAQAIQPEVSPPSPLDEPSVPLEEPGTTGPFPLSSHSELDALAEDLAPIEMPELQADLRAEDERSEAPEPLRSSEVKLEALEPHLDTYPLSRIELSQVPISEVPLSMAMENFESMSLSSPWGPESIELSESCRTPFSPLLEPRGRSWSGYEWNMASQRPLSAEITHFAHSGEGMTTVPLTSEELERNRNRRRLKKTPASPPPLPPPSIKSSLSRPFPIAPSLKVTSAKQPILGRERTTDERPKHPKITAKKVHSGALNTAFAFIDHDSSTDERPLPKDVRDALIEESRKKKSLV